LLWWDALNTLGPNLGYFPKDEKCWIIVKPEKEESVRRKCLPWNGYQYNSAWAETSWSSARFTRVYGGIC
jgi:hypothetical protein